ncbi:MAG: efflux RND transporter periplasmic adaptor subunit [Gammaproteobacteria bacterium]|jgi:RND family efflux transporter MFP subunit
MSKNLAHFSRSAALGAGLALAALLAGCGAQSAQHAAARPVVTQTVTRERQSTADHYTGAIHAHHETELSFRTAGKIVERDAKLGDTVKKGDLLARLDVTDARLSLQAADASVRAAEAQWKLAKREYERYKGLQARGVASVSALDARRNDFDVATAKLHEARNQRSLVKNQLAYTQLRADHDGVITGVIGEVGQVVAAGQPVFRMASSGARELFVDVPESRIDVLRHAQQVQVTLWALPGRAYSGMISEIAADADPVSRTFLVKIALPDAGPEVRLGMSATASVDGEGDYQAVKLPLTSIYHAGDDPAVWVLNPKTSSVELRRIQVGRYVDDGVIVTGGLKTGEVVVTRGVHKLHANEVVAPIVDGAA